MLQTLQDLNSRWFLKQYACLTLWSLMTTGLRLYSARTRFQFQKFIITGFYFPVCKEKSTGARDSTWASSKLFHAG